MFIVFEGVDRVGKTTAIENTAEELKSRGYDVVTIFESNDPIMQYIKQSNLDIDRIVYLVNSMREEHQRLIRMILDSNVILLMDRYYDSTYVYGYESVINDSGVKPFLFNHINPDFTIYLHADPDLIVKRIDSEIDRFTSASISQVKKYLERFDQLYENCGDERDVFKLDVTFLDIDTIRQYCSDMILSRFLHKSKSI